MQQGWRTRSSSARPRRPTRQLGAARQHGRTAAFGTAGEHRHGAAVPDRAACVGQQQALLRGRRPRRWPARWRARRPPAPPARRRPARPSPSAPRPCACAPRPAAPASIRRSRCPASAWPRVPNASGARASCAASEAEHHAAVEALCAARQLRFDRPRAGAGTRLGQPFAQLRAAHAVEREHRAVALQRQPCLGAQAIAGRAQAAADCSLLSAGALRSCCASVASARMSCSCRSSASRCAGASRRVRQAGWMASAHSTKAPSTATASSGQAAIAPAPRPVPALAQRAPLRTDRGRAGRTRRRRRS